MSGTRGRVSAIALAIVMVLSVVAVGAAAPALADEEVPAAYYGEVTIDGDPAPEGTTVTAIVDGEQRGSVVVDEAGQYGDTTRDAERLEVPGSSGDGEVTFLVNGEEVETDPSTVEWSSGDLQQVDLEAEDIGTPSFTVEIDEDASNTSVEPNATATVVADVENTGDGLGKQPVEFAVNDTLEDTVDGVQLEPGETETVAFDTELEGETTVEATVSTLDDEAAVTLSSEDDPGTGPGLPVPDPDPEPDRPDFEVIDGELSQNEVGVGETVEVTATVENVGESGTDTVELLVDGEVETQQKATIDASGTADVTFELTLEQAGTYDVAVGEHTVGTLTVLEDDPDAFDVSDVQVDDTDLEVGESTDVSATVENVGDEAGTFTAELLVDGEVTDETDIALEAGETETVTFTASFDDPGEYEVTVSDADGVTVSVEDDDTDTVPGFGVTAAIVALLSAAIIARRR
ncbi:PGF-CTERM sorting domain-containing protein [Natronorubrum sp. JWXQ-INN-674]|uniref:PGF-CTERM sorting domain-containing protein n=1 Tax=Natronorubrum halalkaliphilum TaxID=2691917 RepID=A0A6B0VMY2_9EURY|nr:CARDB domain-containing protein [Natronorubrum halalkaliphilum]MXV62940.1 PGF-CTERM sorting domain-containing protein [Natronorubrum halalkaliphilum]